MRIVLDNTDNEVHRKVVAGKGPGEAGEVSTTSRSRSKLMVRDKQRSRPKSVDRFMDVKDLHLSTPV